MLQLSKKAQQRLKSATDVLQLIGGGTALAAILLAAVEYFFHVSIFYNPTPSLQAAYVERVVPLYIAGEQFVVEHQSEIAKNDPQLVVRLFSDFVAQHSYQGQLIVAVQALEDIISCESSFVCRVDSYKSYRQPIRSVWYNYRPVLVAMRGTNMPSDFASVLEAEARKILEVDRRAGTTPK
jgi:hypothetical protein